MFVLAVDRKTCFLSLISSSALMSKRAARVLSIVNLMFEGTGKEVLLLLLLLLLLELLLLPAPLPEEAVAGPEIGGLEGLYAGKGAKCATEKDLFESTASL